MPRYKLPDVEFSLPDYIAIPAPQHTVIPRGLYADHPLMRRRAVNARDDHWEIIRRSATAVGMSLNQFVLWCSLASAREIWKQYEIAKGKPPPDRDYIIEAQQKAAPDLTAHSVTMPDKVVVPPQPSTDALDPSAISLPFKTKKIIL